MSGQLRRRAGWAAVAVAVLSQRREALIGRFIVESGQRHVFKVVLALCAPRGFPRCLYGRQQKRDQNTNDGDDDQ